MKSVLFVCLGNICRSPTAEGVFRRRAEQRGLLAGLDVDSAGTGDWHVGKAPDPRAREAAATRGYDLSSLRARQVRVSDFDQYDLILAMDQDNFSDLAAMQPTDGKARLQLFLEYAGMPGAEVPDPYYGGQRGFDQVLDLVEKACDGLLDALESQR